VYSSFAFSQSIVASCTAHTERERENEKERVLASCGGIPARTDVQDKLRGGGGRGKTRERIIEGDEGDITRICVSHEEGRGTYKVREIFEEVD